MVAGRDFDDLPVFGGGEGPNQDGGGQERGEAFLAEHGPDRVRVQADHAGHVIGQPAQGVHELLGLGGLELLEFLELVDDQQGRLRGCFPAQQVAYRRLDGVQVGQRAVGRGAAADQPGGQQGGLARPGRPDDHHDPGRPGPGTCVQEFLQGALPSDEKTGFRGRVGTQADIGGLRDDAGAAHPVQRLRPGRFVLYGDELQRAQQGHELRHQRRDWQVPALEPSLSGRGGHLGYRSGTPDGQPDPASSGRHLLGQGTAAERREHVDYPKGCHLKGGPCARITLSG